MDVSQVLEPLDYHRESKTVVEMKNVLAKYGDKNKSLKPGQYVYHFCINLPKWLPDSTILKTDKSKFFMEYTLRAQMTPLNPKEFVNDRRIETRY